MRPGKGFTLIELMVIISIIGILCTFAMPAFNAIQARLTADMTADKLYHHLNFARTESIMRNIIITVCASQNGRSCLHDQDWSHHDIVVFHDKNSNGDIDAGEPLLRQLNLGLERNSLAWKSFGNKHYLQWLPSGMTYYQNGNFTYCPQNRNPHYARRLILNAAGRIYAGYDRNHDGIQEGTDGKNIQC